MRHAARACASLTALGCPQHRQLCHAWGTCMLQASCSADHDNCTPKTGQRASLSWHACWERLQVWGPSEGHPHSQRGLWKEFRASPGVPMKTGMQPAMMVSLRRRVLAESPGMERQKVALRMRSMMLLSTPHHSCQQLPPLQATDKSSHHLTTGHSLRPCHEARLLMVRTMHAFWSAFY